MNRYARHLGPATGSGNHLAEAIHALHRAGETGDPLILAKALELLVNHVGASLATLVMPHGHTLETRWWHPEVGNEDPPGPIGEFCEWLTTHPDRLLVIGDLHADPHTRHLPELRTLPHKAVLGCAIRHGEVLRALLFVYFDRTRDFPRTEFALLETVAGFMGRAMEVEELKHSLTRLEDALAITKAVMEDTTTWDAETDLPNLRYLEIWQKALLASEPRPESLVVAECRLAIRSRRDLARLRVAAEGVRASDLLVRAGRDRFLILFRSTPQHLAHTMLLRLRTQLGSPPLGATLWIPGPEGLGVESCQPRLDAALAESRATVLPTLVWHLPENHPAAPAAPSKDPRPWQPPVIQRP